MAFADYTSQSAVAVITLNNPYEDLKDADLIIEAVFEDIKVKQPVFERWDKRG